MSVAVGLDVGTTGLKALAVSEDGEVVGRAELEYGLSTPEPGWAEQDPEDWWRAASDALELRRAGYGINGDTRRLGYDLYPYTEDQVAAVKRSVLQWRFIESVAAKIDGPALREAQQNKDAIAAYELVYAALGGE